MKIRRWALAFGLGALLWRMRRGRRESLNGKTVLVTGGSRGLGLVLVREFLQQGCRVVLCARDREEIDRALQQLDSERVIGLPCDVGDLASVKQLVQHVHERWGGIDMLVNNAGIIQTGPVETMRLADYEEAMRAHFWGPLHFILTLLPEMSGRQSGMIINIASIGGKVSMPHLLPYNASKFALVGLSEGLAAELARKKISVLTVCPGLMRTGSPRNAFFKGRHRAEYAWFSVADSLPLLSIDAQRAARKIIRACQRHRTEIILTAPAKAAVVVHGVFPGLTIRVLSWVNRLLPTAGGIGDQRVRGKDSPSALTPSFLTHLSDRAAQQNNEV